MEEQDRLEALVAIMDRLRSPDGCPWDLEQDYESLRRYLIEECHEVAEALDHSDPRALQEELGDLLFQIVFLSRIAKERGEFTINDVIRGIADKMIRRHPHVFGSVTADTSDQVVRNWEAIKRQEKGDRAEGARESLLDGISSSLPPLLKARRIGEKAATVGFDWKRAPDVLDKIDEELQELRRALSDGDRHDVKSEFGDLLFAVVMLSRKLELDPESALERSNLKFRKRFSWMESELERNGVPLDAAGIDVLEKLWGRAKEVLEG